MFVGGIGGAGAIGVGSVGKAADAAAAELFAPTRNGKNDAAKPAATNASFPTRPPAQLGADALFALQQSEPSDGEGKAKEVKESAADQFLDYMKKTPEERLRDKILKALGVTEEDIKDMTPEERMGLEKKIQEIIKETMVKAEGVGEPKADADADVSSQQFLLKQV